MHTYVFLCICISCVVMLFPPPHTKCYYKIITCLLIRVMVNISTKYYTDLIASTFFLSHIYVYVMVPIYAKINILKINSLASQFFYNISPYYTIIILLYYFLEYRLVIFIFSLFLYVCV